MNYKKIYDDLVLRAKSEKRNKFHKDDIDYVYYENHHIIPRCLGGDNKKENKALLTAREHFIAHKLLVEIYPENRNLIYSVWMFVNGAIGVGQERDQAISSREYARYKTIMAQHKSETNRGENHPNYKKPLPQWQKDAISLAQKGKKLSEDHAEKFATCNIGLVRPQKFRDRIAEVMRNQSDETKRKRVESRGDYTHSQETRDKISVANAKRPVLICPYCNYESKNIGHMNKNHFENCLLNPNYVDKRELISCPYCPVVSYNQSNMTRRHGDNCKNKPSD